MATIPEYTTIMKTVHKEINSRIKGVAPEAKFHLQQARTDVATLRDMASSWPCVASPLLIQIIRKLEDTVKRVPKSCDAAAAKTFAAHVYDLLRIVNTLNALFSFVCFGVAVQDTVSAVVDRADNIIQEPQDADMDAASRQPFLDYLVVDLPKWATDLGDKCPPQLHALVQLFESTPGGLMAVLKSKAGGAAAKCMVAMLARRVKPLVDIYLPSQGRTMADLYPAAATHECASKLHQGCGLLSRRLPELFARCAELVPSLYLENGAEGCAAENAGWWRDAMEDLARVLGFRSALSLPAIQHEVVQGNLDTRAHVSDVVQAGVQQMLSKLESVAADKAQLEAEKAQLAASYEAQLAAKDREIAMLQMASAAAGHLTAPMGYSSMLLSGGRGGGVYNNPAFGGSPAACSPALAMSRMYSLARQEQYPCNRG